MPILPYKRVKVGDGLTIRLSQHFVYTDFGVRVEGQQPYGHRYVCTGTPGTGFIERDSESRSYGQFVRDCMQRQRPSYLKLLIGREPSFKREQRVARRALGAATDPMKRRILDSYINALSIGEAEEYLERVQLAIKDRIKHRHHSKYFVSVLSHYKNKVHLLERDMESAQLGVRDTCTEAQYEAWLQVVDAFAKMASCRRIWSQNERSHAEYDQVFFDLGVFDYVRSECYLPVMRTSRGVCYYLLPTCIIEARSSTDFDIVPLGEVNMVCQEMAIQEPIEVLNSRLGDAASMLYVPRFNQRWYFNHVSAIMHYVAAYNELKALQ